MPPDPQPARLSCTTGRRDGGSPGLATDDGLTFNWVTTLSEDDAGRLGFGACLGDVSVFNRTVVQHRAKVGSSAIGRPNGRKLPVVVHCPGLS
jgi:hypothetical protein